MLETRFRQVFKRTLIRSGAIVYSEDLVKFGVCCSPDRSAELIAFGFDFVEWSVASNVGAVDGAGYQQLRRLAGKLPVAPEAWNVLLPGEIKVVGPETDDAALRDYLERALGRVSELGGEVVVFGSGRSRSIPEGFDREQAERQFETACRIVAEVAAVNNLMIALEPLRRGETNMINRVDVGYALVQRIDSPSFRLLADLYHMLDNGEDLSVVVDVADRLDHVHIASRARNVPLEGQDVEDLTAFLRALKRASYDRRVSFECKWENPADLERGLAVLRDACKRV
jgi:sugar phosphate isomerase/epimerase